MCVCVCVCVCVILFLHLLQSFLEMISHSLLNFPAISICVERFVRSEISCKSADDFSSNIVSVNYSDKIYSDKIYCNLALLSF